MTSPLSTSSSAAEETFGSNPACRMAFSASACVLPTTAGTVADATFAWLSK